MAKTRIAYVCQSCSSQSPKWAGQCGDCGAWNTLVEEAIVVASKQTSFAGYAGATAGQAMLLTDVAIEEQTRIPTLLDEFDHVLGGGLVAGSVVLIGGDPGIGKSTLLLQTSAALSAQHCVLYITGEESLQQVRLRAGRLGLEDSRIIMLSQTHVETILMVAKTYNPKIMIIDSIQTMFSDVLQSAPGSVGQVRESAAELVRFAKQTQTSIFLVGHVTKEGSLAGPRVLEHMVDTVLYFEGEQDSRYRILRAVKNRFGAVNELGVFAMTDKGLRGVNNPSAIFLSHYQSSVAGSSILVTREGSRPLLVEVQSLVDDSHLGNPRRVVVGLDPNRLAMLLAVLHRHGGIPTFNQDVFINVVGGIKVSETAADLAMIFAILSSLKNKALASDLVAFGEVGLAGEVRPVQNGQDRLKEAAKLGFKRAIIPKANAPKKPLEGMEVIAVERLSEALESLCFC